MTRPGWRRREDRPDSLGFGSRVGGVHLLEGRHGAASSRGLGCTRQRPHSVLARATRPAAPPALPPSHRPRPEGRHLSGLGRSHFNVRLTGGGGF